MHKSISALVGEAGEPRLHKILLSQVTFFFYDTLTLRYFSTLQ